MTKGKNPIQKPLLIYDGDCGFCQYWVNYWRALTGDRVNYQPYQAVADQFPTLTLEDFQRAVQYVDVDGNISSAAKASLLTLSNASGKAYWLWLYQHLPGFAFASEKSYAVIASHRELFYKISLFLWGKNYQPPQYQLVSWLFIRLFSLILFAAFISFGVQATGLIGKQGILPLNNLIDAANTQLGTVRYWLLPMIFWVNSSDVMIQLVCYGGAAVSLLLLFNQLPRLCLITAYILYLSLIYAGQAFMTFQWDAFLVETAILSLFLIRPSALGIWLMRWLLFRFVFAAGLVKIYSGDPSWPDLTALSYHFVTEPLPTPLAWYASKLPDFFLKAGTLAALVVELPIPFLIFMPRRLRFFAGYCILLMQILITLTGNYNFFNLQTIALCLVCFDDAAVKSILPARLSNWQPRRIQPLKPAAFFRALRIIFAIVTISLSLIEFSVRFGAGNKTPGIYFYDIFSPLRLVNMYGPFAVMTKERMEIIIEGSDDGIEWKEYAFRYKPGDIYRRPPWNIPHQPRLDWQMWFAALSAPQNNPWFLRFIQSLLENSQPVTALLEYNPFPDKPPTYIRALFYQYEYSTQEEKNRLNAWWQRRLTGYYLPNVELTHQKTDQTYTSE